jgi:Family of unknown function (DUF5990)
MAPEVACRIVVLGPPPGVDYGLQKGHGSKYETVQTERSNGDDLRFAFTIGVKAGGKGAPDFGGPFVQGPRGGRFIYIDIGTYAGQTGTPWSRRLKIPLTGITRQAIDRVVRGGVLETRVPGSGRDGSPTCATAKPFVGWTIVR